MSRESSPFGEVHIQITSPCEEISSNIESPQQLLSFSTPIAQTVIPIDDHDEKPHVTFEKEKKKPRKSIDEIKTRRKDTATTFTNFFHRLTRSDKDEKHKSTTSITEEERLLDRPNHLVLPEAEGDNWMEMKTFATDQFRTALDMGNETGMPCYEWFPDSLEEHLLTESAPVRNDLIGMEFDRSEKADLEKSLATILDEFRSGNMRSFSEEQITAMRAAKQDHEDVTNMHLALYSLDSDIPEHDIESRLESVCDSLSAKMISMHNRLADLAPVQRN